MGLMQGLRRTLAMHKDSCIYIYIYIYNPHLGSINPPLMLFSLKTVFFTFNLLSKRQEIDYMLAKSGSLFIYYQKGPVGGPRTLLTEGVY